MSNATLTPLALRCEYRRTPRGVGVASPRLSWKLASDERGQAQTGYRIVVRADVPACGPVLVWDSGWVTSGDHMGVGYAGAPLSSSMRYLWDVQVADAFGVASGTASSEFTTGIVHPDEWRARWIGRDPHTAPGLDVPEDHGRSLRCTHLPTPLQLRRTLRCAGRPLRAHVHATARGLYQLRVNGAAVGDDELTPGWTDYRFRIQYQTYDITRLLDEGENVLAATVADGWFSGYIGFDARHQAMHYGTDPQLLAQLVLDYPDGVRHVLVTDEQWREHPGATQYSDLLMGEQVDARQATTGWQYPGYDDSLWPPAKVLDTDTTTLTSTKDEPVRATQELPARDVRTRDGTTIIDFGQNFVGRVRLTVRGAECGQRVQIRHGELLDNDGELYTANLRSAEATDIYYAAGQPVEVFEPTFTTHGFRWIEVSGYPGELDPGDVIGIVLHSDTEFVGRFDCDHELVNQLQANIVWSQRGNLLSVPTDCPQRDERLGWLADAHIFAPTASLNADTAAFYARWLSDVMDAQDDDGAFPDIAPPVTEFLRREGAPAWGDAGVLIPWLLWRYYGDHRTLERCFGHMCAWVDHIRRHNPDLVWRHRRGNDYGDWLQVDAATPHEVVATAYFARSARTVAMTAGTLGCTDDAAHYHELADAVAQAFVTNFVDDDGRVHGDTQTVYLVAVAFDLLPRRLVRAAIERLGTLISNRGNRLTTGFIGVALLAPTLAAHGRSDLAYALLTQTEYPSWGYSIAGGATTIWERWDAWTEGRGAASAAMNSFNHYSLGSIGEWLYRGVAGIDQTDDSVAWSELVVAPCTEGKLSRAAADYDSARGLIRSAWQRGEDSLQLRLLVPPGAEAIVHLPSTEPAEVTENGTALASATGVRNIRAGDGELVCRVTSGQYAFSVPHG